MGKRNGVNDSEKTLIEEAECELDEITGRKAKRPKMAILNKRDLSKHELDELFCDENNTDFL